MRQVDDRITRNQALARSHQRIIDPRKGQAHGPRSNVSGITHLLSAKVEFLVSRICQAPSPRPSTGSGPGSRNPRPNRRVQPHQRSCSTIRCDPGPAITAYAEHLLHVFGASPERVSEHHDIGFQIMVGHGQGLCLAARRWCPHAGRGRIAADLDKRSSISVDPASGSWCRSQKAPIRRFSLAPSSWEHAPVLGHEHPRPSPGRGGKPDQAGAH